MPGLRIAAVACGATVVLATGCGSTSSAPSTSKPSSSKTTTTRRPVTTLPSRSTTVPTRSPAIPATSVAVTAAPGPTTTRARAVTTTTIALAVTSVDAALITSPGSDQLLQRRNYFAWVITPTGGPVRSGALTIAGIPSAQCTSPIPSGTPGGAPAGIPFGTVSIYCTWEVGITNPTSPDVPSTGPWTAVYTPGAGYAGSAGHN